jgi:hypothetical protein
MTSSTVRFNDEEKKLTVDPGQRAHVVSVAFGCVRVSEFP